MHFRQCLFWDAEGNIVGKLQGARDTDIFLKELKEILGDE